MQQLPLSFELSKDWLTDYLEKRSGRAVSLFITDNSYSILTMMEEKASVKLRLHRMFLYASNDVLVEIANYIENSRIKTPLIRSFINQNTHRIKRKTPKNISLRHIGKYHNLLDTYNTLNREYFNGNINASITWGSVRRKRGAKKSTLGSYSYANKIIRINPMLDSKRVPVYYLKFIIYHEMLHADLGVDATGGRNFYHTREFRRREKLFKHHDSVLKLEKRDKAE